MKVGEDVICIKDQIDGEYSKWERANVEKIASCGAEMYINFDDGSCHTQALVADFKPVYRVTTPADIACQGKY